MAAEPSAREIARRVIDEVLAERSMQRPSVRPQGTSGPGTTGSDAVGAEQRSGRPRAVAPVIDPAARSAARRMVDEVLTAHGLRIAGRGSEPPAVSASTSSPAPHAPPTAPERRIDPQAAAAARRIVDEVLQRHEQAVAGPPPPPSRRERARRHAATPGADAARPAAVLLTDVRTDVDPATAARRIVEQVLLERQGPSDGAGDEPADAELAVAPAVEADPEPDPEPEPEPGPAAEDPIPDELFTAVLPRHGDEGVDPGPVVVDVTDGSGPDGEGTRTAARIVADVLAARVAMTPGTETVEVDVVDVVDREQADDTALADGLVAADRPVADAPVDDRVADDEIWGELDAADDAWSAVVPLASDEPLTADTGEPEADVWPEPSAPRRTGRWLLTTVLGAIALAYLFPLAVRAVRDLVALS